MSAGDKAKILAQLENQAHGKRQALLTIGIPRSTYYRWHQLRRNGLELTQETEERVSVLLIETPSGPSDSIAKPKIETFFEVTMISSQSIH